MSDLTQETEFVEEDDASVDPRQIQDFSQAVLFSTDWTVDTILTQLARANIDLNPRFQRQDAWSIKGKSRFVESIMLGHSIPQIVLAEKRSERDRFIVLDGKQRLLFLLKFAGWAKGKNNGFALSGLEVHQPIFFTSCF